MPLWGKLNQPVTANSTTTHETTQGAPMGVYALVDGKKGTNTVPMTPNSAFGNTSSGSAASIDVNLFQNTTPGAFNYGRAVGVFGVTANQMGNNTSNHLPDQPAHAGWVVRRAGSGPIVSITYSGTANGYSNGDVVTIASAELTTATPNNNATAVISTNATGGALTFAITFAGHGFVSKNNNPGTVANSTGGASIGTGATFNGVAGGRAGRVSNETLVAMGSIVSSNLSVNNSIYPGNN